MLRRDDDVEATSQAEKAVTALLLLGSIEERAPADTKCFFGLGAQENNLPSPQLISDLRRAMTGRSQPKLHDTLAICLTKR